MTDKTALRTRLRAQRRAAAQGAAPIPAPRAFHDHLRPGITVATYRPLPDEADPAAFDAAVLAAGGELLLPHVVDRATPLRFLRWAGEAALTAGPFGLSQPAPDAHERMPDIILTPLVGFDRAGNRLGQGAGHYDRAFATHPAARRIGIAFAVQEVAALPTDAWDVPLHHIATDEEWITPMSDHR